jgi:hypothetical protein
MKYRLVTLLLIVILIAGCSSMNFKKSGSSGGSFKHSSKEGVSVEFVEGKPPKEFFRGEPVDVALKVRNKGRYNIESNDFVLKFKGFAAVELEGGDGIFTGTESIGKINEFGESNEVIIELPSLVYEKEMLARSSENLIEVEYCYPYQTFIESNNFYVGDTEGYVKKGKIYSNDNSAGPVHIKDFKESLSKNKIKFSFIVEKVGKGEIVEDCEDGGKERIYIEITNPSDVVCKNLQGSSSGEIELINGKLFVYCEIDKPEGEEYKSTFSAVLSYYYKNSVGRKVVIKNDNYY